MHELPIIESILDIALSATPSGALVRRVELAVGALCDAEPAWLERYFRVAARGGPCEGARLEVRRVPATLRCAACGSLSEFEFRLGMTAAGRLSCPACGSAEVVVEGGTDYRLERIEVIEGGSR